MSEAEEETVSSLRIDYRKQAVLNDMIFPVVYENGNEKVVSLNDSEGKAYSVSQFISLQV
jgi:hypothetical protein